MHVKRIAAAGATLAAALVVAGPAAAADVGSQPVRHSLTHAHRLHATDAPWGGRAAAPNQATWN